jgi:CHAD domain-containing protein
MALNADRIRKNVRKLGKALKKARKRPNPEEVHGLRTHARRFESMVDALSLDSRANERRLLKRVRRIRKSAGKVRDLDVLTSDLGELHIKGEQNCLVLLFQYLGARRYKHAARLVGSIQRDKAVNRQPNEENIAANRQTVGKQRPDVIAKRGDGGRHGFSHGARVRTRDAWELDSRQSA